MIVEMFGAPGAGKTSLLPAAREFFARRGLRAYSVVEAARPAAARTRPGKVVSRLLRGRLRRFALWQVYYAFCRRYRREFRRQHPGLVEGVLSDQRSRPITRYDRRHVLRWFLHLTGAYAFLMAYLEPDEVLILDEGFVHRVVQLFASEAEELQPARIYAYLDSIPRPDLLIYVSATAGAARQRVFERGVWERFQRKSQAATLRFLERSQAAVELAAGYLASNGWPLVQVHNDGQTLDNVGVELQAELANWTVPADQVK